jgi:hypothetical protein
MERSRAPLFSYLNDVRRHAVLHPWGLWRPRVVHGHFPHEELGKYQKIFFDALLKNGFKRTRWQLVLPGQTAGLVKRIPERDDGVNQYHVRFHEDGSIECEAERHSFDMRHWSGTRYRSVELLEEVLGWVRGDLEQDSIEPIRALFDVKWDRCLDVPARSRKKKI